MAGTFFLSYILKNVATFIFFAVEWLEMFDKWPVHNHSFAPGGMYQQKRPLRVILVIAWAWVVNMHSVSNSKNIDPVANV